MRKRNLRGRRFIQPPYIEETRAWPFKNLLVHIDDGKTCTDRIRAAIALAQAHGAHCPGTRITELIWLHARYADMVVLGQAAHGGELGDHIAEDVLLPSGRPALVVPFIGADQSIRPALALAPS